jgi:hypothetical protein
MSKTLYLVSDTFYKFAGQQFQREGQEVLLLGDDYRYCDPCKDGSDFRRDHRRHHDPSDEIDSCKVCDPCDFDNDDDGDWGGWLLILLIVLLLCGGFGWFGGGRNDCFDSHDGGGSWLLILIVLFLLFNQGDSKKGGFLGNLF